MKEFIKKYEIWVFLMLGPILNICFVKGRIEGIIPSYLYNTGRFCVLLVLLVIILKITRGNKGIINLFKPMLNWKISFKWYLLALIFPLSIATITLLLKGYFFDIDYNQLLTYKFSALTTRAIFALLLWAFLGEVVWVSYCVRELSKSTVYA